MESPITRTRTGKHCVMPTALTRSAADLHRCREAVESPGAAPAPEPVPEKEEKVKKIMKPRAPRPKLTLELLEVGSDWNDQPLTSLSLAEPLCLGAPSRMTHVLKSIPGAQGL